MAYSADKTAYNAGVNADITTQTAPDTVPPEVVGGSMTDLADLLEPYINAINNQALLFGPGAPSSGLGVDLDLYFRQSNPIIIYRKVAGTWIQQGELPLGFTLPDGNLTVQTSIMGFDVFASYGGWVIDGTVYNKTTQTQLTLDAADTNYYRYDNIYADKLNNIQYQVGIASASPVAPTLPADTILIDVAIVPSVVSGFEPYLQSGPNGNDLVHKSSAETLTGEKTWDIGVGVLTSISNWNVRAYTEDGSSDATMNQYGYAVTNTVDGTAVGVGSDMVQFQNNTFQANLEADALSAARTWTLPDQSGTIAMLTDIPGGPVNNIQNGTSLQVGADFNIDGHGTAAGFITTGDGLKYAGTNEGDLVSSTLSTDQEWRLPDDTGTLALTKTSQANTGALSYAGITIASTTQVNIGACEGYVVDNETDPLNPEYILISYAGETNKTVPTLGSGIASYVLLDATGTIQFQNTFPTSAQRKTHIYLSKIGHPTGTINTAGDEVDFITSPLQQHRDLFQALNYINNGVYAAAAGATLNFALSTGVITGDGINFVADSANPNDYTVPAQPTASFLRRTQTGAGGGFTSTIDVGSYDVAGTVTAIPGGGNTSTLRYIFYVPPLGLIVQYGQTTYSNLTNAIAEVGKEAFVIYPSLVRNAILVGVLACTKSATDLSNTAQARFFRADKFGQIIGAQAGVALSTLQSAYNNSVTPEVVTNSTLGAFSVKRGSAADTDVIFEGLNGAGTTNFSVTGEGAVYSADSAHVGGFGLTESFVSPDLAASHQGYTTDGTFHYVFHTDRIDKRNNDGTWSVAVSNASPFTGTTGGLGHLGDGDYYSGVLYVPAKISSGCSSATQKILTYNSTTLAFISQFDISAQGHEAASVAIDGPNNLAYIVSFCDGSKVWKYNATTFSYIGSITLSRSLTKIQGVAYYSGKLYISSEENGLLTHDLTTGALTQLMAPLASYTLPEGLAVVAGQVRWLVDNSLDGTGISHVRFFDPSTTPQGFYTDASAKSYFTGKLRVDNALSVLTTTNDKGSIHAATRLGISSALYMESGDPNLTAPLIGTVGHDGSNTFLSRNAEFIESQWFRSDVTKNSFSYQQQNAQHLWRTATAGANPITWVDRMSITTTGLLTTSSSEQAMDITGAIATDHLIDIRNSNASGASSIVAFDDASTKSLSVGVLNTATTLNSSYGVAGEGYIRSGTNNPGLHFSAVTGPIRFSVSNGTEAARIFQATRNITVGGTTDAGFKFDVRGTTRVLNTLDVYGGAGISLFGSDTAASTTRTDATNKSLRIAAPHYLTAEEPVAAFNISAAVSTNTLNIGGGSGIMNAATLINFYTASNNATTTGTVRMAIDSSGDITHSGNLTTNNLVMKSLSADPTASNIPAGMYQVYKNTTSGTVKLWANDGGTLKSVALV